VISGVFKSAAILILTVVSSLGAAAAGLSLLRVARDPGAAELIEAHPALIAAHRRPQVRAGAGPAAAAAGATAMIDVSDGFAQDAGHLADESRLGLVVEADVLPVAAGVGEVSEFLGRDPFMVAASGGDDYELAIAVPPDRVEAVRAAIAPVPLTVVGAFAGTEQVLVRGRDRYPLSSLGWEHFA